MYAIWPPWFFSSRSAPSIIFCSNPTAVTNNIKRSLQLAVSIFVGTPFSICSQATSMGITFDLVPNKAWARAFAVPIGMIAKCTLLSTNTDATSVNVPSPPHAITILAPASTACSAKVLALISGVVSTILSCIEADKRCSINSRFSGHFPAPDTGFAINQVGALGLNFPPSNILHNARS